MAAPLPTGRAIPTDGGPTNPSNQVEIGRPAVGINHLPADPTRPRRCKPPPCGPGDLRRIHITSVTTTRAPPLVSYPLPETTTRAARSVPAAVLASLGIQGPFTVRRTHLGSALETSDFEGLAMLRPDLYWLSVFTSEGEREREVSERGRGGETRGVRARADKASERADRTSAIPARRAGLPLYPITNYQLKAASFGTEAEVCSILAPLVSVPPPRPGPTAVPGTNLPPLRVRAGASELARPTYRPMHADRPAQRMVGLVVLAQDPI